MKKILIACSLVFGIVAILLAITLIKNPTEQQNPLSALTPEETAVRHVKGMTEAGFHIDTNTVAAIQQVEINEMVLVLVQYSGHRIEGDVKLCEMVVEIEKSRALGWIAKNGASLCHEVNEPLNDIPITVVSNYGTSNFLDHGYSSAFGYFRTDQIAKVTVTWADGWAKSASVSARTYMSAREGKFYVAKIETFNDLGEIVYTSQIIPAQDNPTNR